MPWQVMGRDKESVFPSLQKRKPGEMSQEEASEVLGTGGKFVSESQLERMKQGHGERADDGTAPPNKPLWEVLKEREEEKQREREERERLSKQGTNKPLDDEEVEFLEKARDAVESVESQARKEEEEELRQFRHLRSASSEPSRQHLPHASEPEPSAKRKAPNLRIHAIQKASRKRASPSGEGPSRRQEAVDDGAPDPLAALSSYADDDGA